jgi:hypothetical protein
VDAIERFKDRIAWYSPTEDTGNWREFFNTTYNVDYASATAEQLKRIAWDSKNIGGGPDTGMWAQRAGNLEKFLGADMALSDYNPIERIAIEYDFVACFLNNYEHAAHNEDLWQSINNAAVETLREEISPSGARLVEPEGAINPEWLRSDIPETLYEAVKEINISYYRPTEDTKTWAYFQSVVLDLTALPLMQFTYRRAYLLRNIESGADPAPWEQLATAARAFLDANLGMAPADAQEQYELAFKLCGVMLINRSVAKHNEDLFKAYHDAFEKAEQKLRYLA